MYAARHMDPREIQPQRESRSAGTPLDAGATAEAAAGGIADWVRTFGRRTPGRAVPRDDTLFELLDEAIVKRSRFAPRQVSPENVCLASSRSTDDQNNPHSTQTWVPIVRTRTSGGEIRKNRFL